MKRYYTSDRLYAAWDISQDSYRFGKYTIKRTNDDTFRGYLESTPVTPECPTSDECENLLIDIENPEDRQKDHQKERLIKIPSSVIYKKVRLKEVDLSKLQDVFVLQRGTQFYSHSGLVRYKDDRMTVFTSKEAAQAASDHTSESYTVVRIKLNNSHSF